MVLTTVSDRREHCTKTVGTKQRSSPHMFFVCEKGVRKNFKKKFTGKYLCQSRPATLLKKRLWHRCFLVIFAKILRIPFSLFFNYQQVNFSICVNYENILNISFTTDELKNAVKSPQANSSVVLKSIFPKCLNVPDNQILAITTTFCLKQQHFLMQQDSSIYSTTWSRRLLQ